MAIDTAEKRRAASGLQFTPLPYVSPNVSKDADWRAQTLGIYYLTTAVNPSVTADQGSYTLTGQSAGLVVNRLVTLSQENYALTGQSVSLLSTRLLALAQGSYTLTGQSSGVLAGRLVTSEVGSYTLSGQATSFLARRILALVTGTYTLTGQDATFVITSVQNHFLYGVLWWNRDRDNTLLVANDNTVYLVGMVDLQDRRNVDGTPKFLDSGVTVTWEIRDAAYPGGSLVAQGTGELEGEGGRARIDISEDVAITADNVYWLNVMFSNSMGNGLISARFLARTRTGRTIGT